MAQTRKESITVILDIDGTLVDTNYQHAIAWYRALRRYDYTVQLWEIHRHIGEVEPMDGARGLIEDLRKTARA